MPHTKIVATLGPATDSAEKIRQLIDAGVSVFRLNASHGSPDDHIQRIREVRAVAAGAGRPIGILFDLQGPKIRLGQFEKGSVRLESGATFTITVEPLMGNERIASTNYAEFARDVRPGDRVLLADGSVELRVKETNGTEATCEVTSGGVIGDRKGINLPGVPVSAASLTKKDRADLQYALEEGVDMVALSFVRRPSDVLRLRLFLEEREASIPVIAKIEKPEAWESLDEILLEADGVMVARGDLGVEMPLERVPTIQKSIIERAREHGKFVITATQMLESMVTNAVPTRAEVSDVANAIYDGTDAVMLSAETSVGRFPVEAAQTMRRIAQETERLLKEKGFKPTPERPAPTDAEIVADSAFHAARMASASAIVVFTSSGSSAKKLARLRPPVPIYAFTHQEQVARQLAVVFGVRSFVVPMAPTSDEMIEQVDRFLVARGRVRPMDPIIFVCGQPMGRPGTTNTMKVHRIGEIRHAVPEAQAAEAITEQSL